jgi:pantoate kinase
MDYDAIGLVLHETAGNARIIVFRALHKLATNQAIQRQSVPLIQKDAARRLKALRRLEAEAAHALNLAAEAGLQPRLVSELSEIHRRARRARYHLESASVFIRCGSIECRPEKWLFFGVASR